MATIKEFFRNVKVGAEAKLNRRILFQGATAEQAVKNYFGQLKEGEPADISAVVVFVLTAADRSYVTDSNGIIVGDVNTPKEVLRLVYQRGVINLRTRFKDGSFYQLRLGLVED